MQKRIRNLSDREKQQIGEQNYIKRLLELYPKGIVSVVSDTFNLWDVLTIYLPQLKDQILKRDGKLVIRPDSGDPVDIICGTDYIENKVYTHNSREDCEARGVIELLWTIFGGTINKQGYKVLDPHIGAIYGDSITMDRAKQICERLKVKGFASTNIVLGIGSMSYTGGETKEGSQYWITRDLFSFAIKSTYGEITHVKTEEFTKTESREIFKDPITDDGTKKSKKGLLQVTNKCTCSETKAIDCGSKCKNIHVIDQCTWEEEKEGMLQTVFKDGKLVRTTSLEEIRSKLNNI